MRATCTATVHRSLGASPRLAWEQAWTREKGIEVPALPADRTTFLLDFLPAVRRVIGREGIELSCLRSIRTRSLAGEVNPTVKRVVRFDPRDLSRVYVEGKHGHYLTVPLRDARWPPMSHWEWRAIRRHQRFQAERADGDRIGKALERLSLVAADQRTPLRRQRRLARRAEWQALQAIQALPAPNVTLASTLMSESGPDDLEWEVLE